ncbi:hypothetical protein B0H10DRAFT_1958491 [Mycena sp. CBHHK59/15]|nr:hypothetical protein B0H10DRAFT_1958491 [Mycena sp. CBHHK59/15]
MAINKNWRVTKKMSTGRLVEDSEGDSLEPYNARAFVEGDFVDVCIGFDIVSKRQARRGDLHHSVRYTIQHVLLLKSAAAIKVDVPEPTISGGAEGASRDSY